MFISQYHRLIVAMCLGLLASPVSADAPDGPPVEPRPHLPVEPAADALIQPDPSRR